MSDDEGIQIQTEGEEILDETMEDMDQYLQDWEDAGNRRAPLHPKMDPEAVIYDDNLSASVSMRRRSHSVSDDYSVQRTNDDATQCKFAAVQLNYWDDKFLKVFAMGSGAEANSRRDPEISIGYWARVAAVNKYVEEFISKTDGKCQIISLGCGFDTLFWRLRSTGKNFERYVEVDFSSVTSKKIRLIRKPGSQELFQYFTEQPHEEQHTDLHAGSYNLVGADIRQWNELQAKFDAAGVDYKLPTLFIAECVLVYMSADQSAELLKNISEQFDTVAFLNYEQLRTSDTFGRVMEKNMEQRGLQMPGLTACQSTETQRERFVDNGWPHVTVMDMNTVYKKILLESEVTRVTSIEHLDEMELLYQLLDHYCLVHAVKDSTEQFVSRLVVHSP